MKSSFQKGRPLAIAYNAVSMSREEPAFIARPPGAPVYHGFRVLNDVVVDGFTFGMITDFEAESATEGAALAEHEGLTVYDAAYLDLSMREKITSRQC